MESIGRESNRKASEVLRTDNGLEYLSEESTEFARIMA